MHALAHALPMTGQFPGIHPPFREVRCQLHNRAYNRYAVYQNACKVHVHKAVTKINKCRSIDERSQIPQPTLLILEDRQPVYTHSQATTVVMNQGRQRG